MRHCYYCSLHVTDCYIYVLSSLLSGLLEVPFGVLGNLPGKMADARYPQVMVNRMKTVYPRDSNKRSTSENLEGYQVREKSTRRRL